MQLEEGDELMSHTFCALKGSFLAHWWQDITWKEGGKSYYVFFGNFLFHNRFCEHYWGKSKQNILYPISKI